MTMVSHQLPRQPASAGTAREIVNAHTSVLGLERRDDAAAFFAEVVESFTYLGCEIEPA